MIISRTLYKYIIHKKTMTLTTLTILLFCLAHVHGISISTITGTTLSAAGGIILFQGTGFTTVGPMLCAMIPTYNHAMNIISDSLMTCVIQDEGAMGSRYPLYVANSTVILFTFINEMYVTPNYPQITSLGTEYQGSGPLTTWLPNCAINAGYYLAYGGNYIPNDPTLYRYMELKSSGGYSYSVVYPSTTSFVVPNPYSPSPTISLIIFYNANTVVTSGVWADMYLAWGTGGSYTKITAGLQLCDDGHACGGSRTNYCFLKGNKFVVVNSTTYYDPSPSMRHRHDLLSKPWNQLNQLDVLAKHPVKAFNSSKEYVNTYVLCHDMACV
jgi:hypothetical protein